MTRLIFTVIFVIVAFLVIFQIAESSTFYIIDDNNDDPSEIPLDFLREDYNTFGTTSAITMGDVDNDGNKDILVALEYMYFNYLTVFKGPEFKPGMYIESSGSITDMDLSYINNDDYLDLITSITYNNEIGVSMGSAEGFHNFTYFRLLNLSPNYLLSQDVNNDSCGDLAFTSWTSVKTYIALGICIGDFTPSQIFDCDV